MSRRALQNPNQPICPWRTFLLAIKSVRGKKIICIIYFGLVQGTINSLQTENMRLLSENIRLSQLLRRHGISSGPPSTSIPLRRCDSGLSDHSVSRSGSISDLRGKAFDSNGEDVDDDFGISPIRPTKGIKF